MVEDNDAMVQNDPFKEIAEYNNMTSPDVPINFGSDMIDAMLNNDEVPADIRAKYWYLLHKDNVLGFLDDARKRDKMLAFDIIKLDQIATLPRRSYKFDTELEFDILRNFFETKLDRAVGTNATSSSMNERKSLISQISENRQVSESDDGLVKDSFIKKLMGSKGR